MKLHIRGQAFIQLEQTYYTVGAGVSPINTPLYRINVSQKEEVDCQVKQLLEDGITAKSDSPWNSPLLVVPRR